MAEEFFTLLTVKGQQKVAAATAGGPAVVLTHLAVGDSGGAYYNPTDSQTALKNEKHRTVLSSLTQDDKNQNWFIAEALIPDEIGGFMIREIGVFDQAGDLFAVGKVPETYKPLLPQGSDKQLYIRCIFQVSNADAVTIKIDPSIILATRSYVDEAIGRAINRLDWKQSVRAATTANINLTGLLTIDGIKLAAGDRVLVKNQTDAKQNGLYIATSGYWARAADADENTEVTPSMAVMVESGSTQADTLWTLATDGVVKIGQTALTFKNVREGLATDAAVGAHVGNTAAHVTDAERIAWNGMLPKAGGTMTGPLTLSGANAVVVLAADPTAAMHAATKQYVDTKVSSSTPDLSACVQRSGDAMTGPLTLSGAPTSALHAATKGYADELQVIRAAGATVSASRAVVIASDSDCSVGGGRSACIASMDSSVGNRSGDCVCMSAQHCAIGDSVSRSVIFGSNRCRSDHVGVTILSSMCTAATEPYTIVYGHSAGSGASSANRKMQVSPNGNVQIAGTLTQSATFTDYAEFFENKTKGVIPLGSIVALDEDRVRPAQGSDDILGVVTGTLIDVKNGGKRYSGTGAVIAGDSPFTWSKRCLTGEFGETLYEHVPDPAWQAQIPDPGWTPADGQTEADRPMIDNPVPCSMMDLPIENPAFDPTQNNIPRSQRPEEWTCVGLLGQVHVRVDDAVTVGAYVQAAIDGVGTKSTAKTNLRCMRIKQAFDAGKGYAVAFCLLK